MTTFSCQDIQEMIQTAELRMPLTDDQRAVMTAHLDRCGDCQDFQNREKALSEQMDDGFISIAREGLHLTETIQAALPEQKPAPAARRFSFTRLEAAAALVLFSAGLFVGYVLTRPAGETPPAPNGSAGIHQNAGDTARPRYISAGQRSHQVLPDKFFRSSERRSVKLRLPGSSDIRLEVDYEELLLEDLRKRFPEIFKSRVAPGKTTL